MAVNVLSIYTDFENVLKSLGMDEITHPLFYNSKVGIRFNIGGNGNKIYTDDDNVNPQYISTCLERAKIIYKELPLKPNVLIIEGFLDENDISYEASNVEEFIEYIISFTKLSVPDEIKKVVCYEEKEMFEKVCLCWNLESFNPDKLLEEIIKSDFCNGCQALSSSVYFANTVNNTIFHLYDDRGADLVADNTETLINVYKNLNDLILDYDREKIDGVFSGK